MPIWQREKWEEILNVAKQKPILVGWVAAHQGGDHPAHILNNQVDSLTRLAVLAEERGEMGTLIGVATCQMWLLGSQRSSYGGWEQRIAC